MEIGDPDLLSERASAMWPNLAISSWQDAITLGTLLAGCKEGRRGIAGQGEEPIWDLFTSSWRTLDEVFLEQ